MSRCHKSDVSLKHFYHNFLHCSYVVGLTTAGPTCKGFQCDNNLCINLSWKCDGGNDCGDNSDEMDCQSNSTCSSHEFRCSNNHCIIRQWLCDGDRDCLNGEDEDNCSTTRQ